MDSTQRVNLKQTSGTQNFSKIKNDSLSLTERNHFDSLHMDNKSSHTGNLTVALKAQASEYVHSMKTQKMRKKIKGKKGSKNGISIGKSKRPFLRKKRHKNPGVGDYTIDRSLGNGNAVGWGKPKRKEFLELKMKLLKQFGEVGPGTYDLKPTFPQLQDWERRKLESLK